MFVLFSARSELFRHIQIRFHNLDPDPTIGLNRIHQKEMKCWYVNNVVLKFVKV